MRILATLAMFALVQTADLFAATYFVRSGAFGNGTSWVKAWGNVSSIVWSSLSAGDTVCVAGGKYSGSINTGKSGTSGNPITIKRATASDTTCGSSTRGWNSSYDSQAVIDGINLANDYVVIDGGAWSRGTQWSGGFCMTLAQGEDSAVTVSAPTNRVTLRYIEVSGPCGPLGCNQSGDGRSINLNHWNGSSYDLQNNMLIQYVNLHGACTLLWIAHSMNGIIEHSRFADNMDNRPGNPDCHPNVIATQDSTNMTFRYNEVVNWEVEGIMACPRSSCSSSWDIYGNVWHDPYGGDNVARVLEPQYGSSGPYHVYNNTFVGVGQSRVFSTGGGSYASGSESLNNIFWNSTPGNIPSMDYDFSDSSLSETHGQGNASDPFVNSSAKTVPGYHLSSHTNEGQNLGLRYNVDYDGNVRTNWDRGAFEFQTRRAPTVSLTSSLTFGSQSVGTTSAPESATLQNAGSATLNITSIMPNGDFAIINQTCGSTLNAGSSCTFSVTFAPTAAGTRTGTVSVIDNAGGSPHTVSLSGTGGLPVP